MPKRTGDYCPAAPPETSVEGQRVCLTEEDCFAASVELGMTLSVGQYPTKGCFSKARNVYFSLGTKEEMSNLDLPKAQTRVWCRTDQKDPPMNNPTEEGSTFEQREVACLTEKDCLAASMEMGMDIFLSSAFYQTKGCYTKNGKAFFSPGSKAEMSTTKLVGVQERIWCKDREAATPSLPPPDIVAKQTVCLTQQDCNRRRQDLGVDVFYSGSFSTKGCFLKNAQSSKKAFWSSGGSREEQSTELSGLQERIWCNGGTTTKIALLSEAMTGGEIVVQSDAHIIKHGQVALVVLTTIGTLLIA